MRRPSGFSSQSLCSQFSRTHRPALVAMCFRNTGARELCLLGFENEVDIMSATVSQYFHLTQLIQLGVHRLEDSLRHTVPPGQLS